MVPLIPILWSEPPVTVQAVQDSCCKTQIASKLITLTEGAAVKKLGEERGHLQATTVHGSCRKAACITVLPKYAWLPLLNIYLEVHYFRAYGPHSRLSSFQGKMGCQLQYVHSDKYWLVVVCTGLYNSSQIQHGSKLGAALS